jgi:hypothetical protein
MRILAVLACLVFASPVLSQSLLGVEAQVPAPEAPPVVASPAVPPPPAWPAASDASAWKTGRGLSDAEVDEVLVRFVKLVVQELEVRRKPITFERLMTALCLCWVRKTPYGSNQPALARVARAPQSIVQRKNDYRLIVRRGWGICGDHQLLLLRLVTLALNEPQLAHLRPERERVQDLSVVSDARLPLDFMTSNHGAVGLVKTAAYAKTVRTLKNGQQQQVWSNLAPEDIAVYDLWMRPPLTGKQHAAAWGEHYVKSNFRSETSLAPHRFTLNFGELTYWERSY